MSGQRFDPLRGYPLMAGLVAGLVLAGGSPAARASSHAEAPMIAEDAQADNTDLYAFKSPEDPRKIVVISNFIPAEEPSGGPNYKTFSDSVLYEIKVDRDNDGYEDVAYQFEFSTKIQTPGTFLNFLGPITSLTTNGSAVDNGSNVNPLYNRYQTYTLRRVTTRGGSRTVDTLARNVLVPPPNVGASTVPNYAPLADQAIYAVPGTGIRVFAGQRDDPFFLDLGAIFDLLSVRPYRSLNALMPPGGNRANPGDSLAGFNVHSIVMEIPIVDLTGTSLPPASDNPRRLVGFWSTASRRRVSILRNRSATIQDGDWVQVSRLGAPLVNELFIPIKDPNGYTKDYWNGGPPYEDVRFLSRFQRPEAALRLAQLYPALRGVVPFINADQTGFTQDRTDLLGGVTPLLNFAPDELRIDTSLPAVQQGAAGYNRLGVIAGDLGGFPNGRRLSDDVVDVYMRAAAGVLVPGNVGSPPVTRAAFLDSIKFGDGVDANTDATFLTKFPFVALPHDGLNPPHNNNKAQGTD
jgi:uncharacterized protein DUF4331